MATDNNNAAFAQKNGGGIMQFMRSNAGKALGREIKDYFFITLGLMLYTFGFTVFLLPYEIVTGGIAGVGAIVFYATKFPVQWTFFIINAALIVAALKILGWRFLAKTIYATFALTVMLDIAQKVVEMPDGTFYKLMGEGNDFMSLVIGCMLTGTALAIVFLNNGSTGGTDIIAAVVNKYHNISLGMGLIMVDLCIISSSLLIESFGTFPREMHDGGVRTMYDVHRMQHARLRDELAATVRAVHDILKETPGDCQRHSKGDRAHNDNTRRSRMVFRRPYKGDLPHGKEKGKRGNLPRHKVYRP